MSKLTLSVDKDVIAHAKRYAGQHGISVSELVEAYLAGIARPSSSGRADPPILRSLRGALKKAALDDHPRHLAVKYR